MRLVLVAEEAAGIQLLRALAQRDDELVAVMARADREMTAGASVWAVARNMGYPTWPAEEVRDAGLAGRLHAADVDLVLNVHSLFIVHPAALEAARFGWYNLHPGSLPHFAGLNTVSWAIYEGESVQGVTIHRMAPAIDAGPIAYRETFPIEPTDTGLSLSSKCVRVGVRLMLELVETMGRDPAAVPAIAQDAGSLRYFKRGDIPQGGRFDWDLPARRVVDVIRAFDYHPLPSPWGHPRMAIAGREVGVIGATVTGRRCDVEPGSFEPNDDGSLLVACRDEWVSIRKIHDGQRIQDSVGAIQMVTDRVGGCP